MSACRVLTFAAAFCVIAAMVEADQGRSAGRGSGPAPASGRASGRPAQNARAGRPTPRPQPDSTISALANARVDSFLVSLGYIK